MDDDIGMWNIVPYHRELMAGRTPNIDKLAIFSMRTYVKGDTLMKKTLAILLILVLSSVAYASDSDLLQKAKAGVNHVG